MKLVTFTQEDSAPSIGVLASGGRTIVILQNGAKAANGDTSPYFTDMLAFLRGGSAARDQAQAIVEYVSSQRPPDAVISLDRVTLLAPVPRPESLRDTMAFEQHIINCTRVVGLKRFGFVDEWIEKAFGRRRTLAYRFNKAWYERPIYYKSNRFSVVGPESEVRLPAYSQKLDYELEWGIFIGRSGVDIAKAQAREYIGGYTLFNDFSARDIQMREMGGRLGPAKGKDFDTGNAMGPCLVTPDEVPDPYNLAMTARINGAEWSRGTSADMYWSFEEIIAYISQSETLYPGEFIGSGTCSGAQGRGCGLEMGKRLKAGDLIELEVESLGILRNKIVSSRKRLSGKGRRRFETNKASCWRS